MRVTAAVTDPCSIIAGIIGIATAALQSSKVFFELLNDIKGGPAEIRSISRDIHAFSAILFSLNATLEKINFNNVITCNEAIVNIIENLARPLKNCQAALGELMVKIRQLGPRSKNKEFRIATISAKWGLLTKSEIVGLQLRLEDANRCCDHVRNTSCLPYCGQY